ncbi:TPA: hypothetical protein SMQ12_001642 [Proteus mirabilis]|nr:hypothetical protein [Proteus mirabilis]HEK1023579.1 hypothetical protein [Proteus mirabilis]HEK1945249.1 hypothetical protein [Proteus mirabilis]
MISFDKASFTFCSLAVCKSGALYPAGRTLVPVSPFHFHSGDTAKVSPSIIEVTLNTGIVAPLVFQTIAFLSAPYIKQNACQNTYHQLTNCYLKENIKKTE